MSALVLDRHRPTMAELVAGWPPGRRRGALAVLVLVVGAGAVLALTRPTDRGYVHRGGLTFNLLLGEGLRPAPPQGDEVARFAESRGPLFLQSFSVAPLALPAYRGDIGALLPVLADAELHRLRGLYPGMTVTQEGKLRLAESPAYTIGFATRLGNRRLYGRSALVADPAPGSHAAARLLLLATPAAGVSSAYDVGLRGQTKKPYRSFRFGTDRP